MIRFHALHDLRRYTIIEMPSPRNGTSAFLNPLFPPSRFGVRHRTLFYQPTRVLLNKTPTRLREHNCLAKDGPLHSYGGCDGVVVSFLYSGVICVGVSVVYTRGCIGFCSVCLFSLRSVDYVMECAGYCRMYLFAHSRATHRVILVGCRRVC